MIPKEKLDKTAAEIADWMFEGLPNLWISGKEVNKTKQQLIDKIKESVEHLLIEK